MEQHKQPDITRLLHHPRYHKLGSAVRHPEKQLQIVPIPKCASTWLKDVIRYLNWSEHNFVTKDTYTWSTLVILREPYDRWCSSMGEWIQRRFGRQHDSVKQFIKDLTKYHEDNPDITEWDDKWHWIEKIMAMGAPHDEHTEMQSAYLYNIDHTNMIAFNFDKSLSKQVSEWFKQELGIHNEFDLLKPKWLRRPQDVKSYVYKYLLSRKKVLLPHIKQVYKSDFVLYNNVMGNKE